MKLFLEKARANGIDRSASEAIWALMLNFAEYSYCKAHASTYGEISYQCTYLKAHFPAEFLASVLANHGGFYHSAVYIEEAKRLGVAIRPPDVNRSGFDYAAEGDAIRFGLQEIGRMHGDTSHAIVRGRDAGAYQSVSDLCRRGGVRRGDAEALIHAGACDGFGRTRPEMLWELKGLERQGAIGKRAAAARGSSLVPKRTIHSPPARLFAEEACRPGMEYAGAPAVDPSNRVLRPGAVEHLLVLSEDMAAYAGRTVTMVGWLIAERRVGLKKQGCMKFLTFEDPAGVFEAVLFPRAYQQYGHLVRSHGPYFVTGDIQEEDGCHSLIAEHVECVGHASRSTRLSTITPPLRWIWPGLAGDGISHAD